jgi:hypothetical protein
MNMEMQIIDLWEQCRTASSKVEAAVTLASAHDPGRDAWSMSIGTRDRAIIELRARLFGNKLTGTDCCSACGQQVDVNISLPDLLDASEDTNGNGDPLFLETDGWQLGLRLPTSDDVAAVIVSKDSERALFELCMVELKHLGEDVSTDELPERIVAVAQQRLAQAESLADIQLRIECPSCGRKWDSCLDIGSIFLVELDAYVKRICNDVHLLASAYGWSEREILEMPSARRQLYLEMVQA